MKKTNEEFMDCLNRSSEITDQWPGWKKNVWLDRGTEKELPVLKQDFSKLFGNGNFRILVKI